MQLVRPGRGGEVGGGGGVGGGGAVGCLPTSGLMIELGFSTTGQCECLHPLTGLVCFYRYVLALWFL